MQHALFVALGGGLGSLARWLLSTEMHRRWSLAFPIGTLAVNVLGCLAAGLLVGWLEARTTPSESWRLFLVVGVLGGFTTFSAFGLDALTLAKDGRPGAAALYVGANVGLGLGAAWIGRALGG